MADQLTEPPYEREALVPPEAGWKALLPLDGAALEDQYRKSLETLGAERGMLGVIFRGARCEIRNPARLKQLIANLLDQVDWLSLPVDVKGTIYEELLSRSAQESSRGAGQYFTPRPVIQAMCDVTQPTPEDRICDPAAGTGGFLCNAYQHVLDRHPRDLDRDELRALQTDLVEGMEISPKVGRMCAMNLYLHGIGGEKVVVHTGHDSLSAPWGREYSMVLANPPFGKKQSLLFVNRGGRHGEGGSGRRPRGLLDLHQQQAAQLRAAHLYAAEDRRPAPPWCCRTTCSSRAERERGCDATCWRNAASTPCCGCRPASGILPASRPT